MMFDEGSYWNERYLSGKTSGAGSYGRLANFKADFINRLISSHEIQTVLDFGCGDGNQVSLLNIPQYVGLDISSRAVDICSERFRNNPSKRFLRYGEHRNEKAELTQSLDVIYHIVNDDAFEDYMNDLFSSATRMVLIYSTNHDEVFKEGWHMRHRKFTDWTDKRPEFELISVTPNEFQPSGQRQHDQNASACSFFLFERTEPENNLREDIDLTPLK